MNVQAQSPVMFHSLGRDWTIVAVTQQWLDGLGYQREEVIGRRFTDFLSETSRRHAEDTLLPHYQTSGFCTDVPYQIVTKSGESVHVLFSASVHTDASGEVVGSSAMLRDLTEQERAEKALRDEKEIFFRAFHASGAILMLSTLATGRFIEVNQAFERIIGYRRDEAIGRESGTLKIWENAKDRGEYVRLLRDQGKVRDLEVRLRSRNGRALVGLLSGELVELEGEQCLLSTVNDMTDRKRHAEEMEVLHTELAAHAHALEIANEELETFSYTVSHDLRKPLTAISGYCQILLNVSECEPEDCRSFLNEILNGTVRMTELIATLLEFSRLSHSDLYKGPVDLTALALDAAKEVRASDPGRKVQFRIAEGVTGVGDETLLRVVLDNLIGNAWKYTALREAAVIEFGSAGIDGGSALFVRDNGVGFKVSAGGQTLFKPFHRQPGTETFSGFGIGLATVNRIVKRHGGRVWAEGSPGKGATFYFTIS